MAYPNPADDDWLLSSFIDFDNFDPSSGNPWTSTDPSEPSNTAGVNTESNGRLESYLVPEAVASRQAKKRRPCRFTKKQREVMDQWITAATNEPYLTASSRKELADATGLAPKQVQQYFTNFRRRHRQKLGQIYDPPFVLQDRPLTTSWQTGFEGTIDRTCEEADKVSGHDVDSDGPGLSIEARPPSRRSCQSSSSADSALSYTDVCGSAAALHQANSAEAFATFNGTLLEFYLLTVHQNQAASPRDSAVPALLERNDRPTHLTSPSESPTKAVHALTDTNPSSPELIGPDEPLSASGSIFSGHSYQHSTDNSVASTSSVFSTGSRRGRRVFGSSNARAADFDSGKEFRKARAQDIFSRYCRFRGMLTMTTWREVLIEASCKIVNNYWLSYPHPEIVVDTGSEAVSMADRSTIISPADSFDCTTAMQALELPLFNAG
ncbi:uncharacterized protein HMPREF1541_09722 [Cyphellophora europaea CBS 101466]|uniref:Homeobox domain-containing protein n=1 Tax=Cyphellophora europaea (strain CBS 101466) TaxID=1220924 RepID=W2S842_CYPE1|nr:uncharacterized protein HMPREF1541_09722 [Cyphellophora europaea CBS 101466]ETN44847.1 hypothetical protein HMPREF1541_09722 [Cyphellophora europaea CBS 101466]